MVKRQSEIYTGVAKKKPVLRTKVGFFYTLIINSNNFQEEL